MQGDACVAKRQCGREQLLQRQDGADGKICQRKIAGEFFGCVTNPTAKTVFADLTIGEGA